MAKKKSKSSFKSTEFWLSAIAVIVGLLLTSGILGDGSTVIKYVGAGSALLVSMGYTAARSRAKQDASKPGYKTTEFWINAVSALSGIAMTVGVKGAEVASEAAGAAGEALASDPTTGAIGIGLAALNAAIYAGSRGKLKAKEE